MPRPRLWIVAGPNGSGKTTTVKREPIAVLLRGIDFLNPDVLTLESLRSLGFEGFADAPLEIQAREFRLAADRVYLSLSERLQRGESLGVETVLSTEKYASLVSELWPYRGFTGLIYIAVNSPQIAVARVARRVTEHGHGVPEDKIIDRWQRSLQKLGWFLSHSHLFWIFDNSGSDPAIDPPLIASGRFGQVQHIAEECFPEMREVLEKLPHLG